MSYSYKVKLTLSTPLRAIKPVSKILLWHTSHAPNRIQFLAILCPRLDGNHNNCWKLSATRQSYIQHQMGKRGKNIHMSPCACFFLIWQHLTLTPEIRVVFSYTQPSSETCSVYVTVLSSPTSTLHWEFSEASSESYIWSIIIFQPSQDSIQH